MQIKQSNVTRPSVIKLHDVKESILLSTNFKCTKKTKNEAHHTLLELHTLCQTGLTHKTVIKCVFSFNFIVCGSIFFFFRQITPECSHALMKRCLSLENVNGFPLTTCPDADSQQSDIQKNFYWKSFLIQPHIQPPAEGCTDFSVYILCMYFKPAVVFHCLGVTCRYSESREGDVTQTLD